MKANDTLTRLKENVGLKSGCSVLYLKSLRSDLNRLLKQYMALDDIDFDLTEQSDGYFLNINLSVKEFFDIGKGE